jgi:NAD(P)H-flavin reductase
MTPAPFRVAERAQDTADTWTLALVPLEAPEPVVAPGQFMMVYAFGVGEVPVSVSGPPFVPGPVVLTVRAVGAVSRAICRSDVGDVLGLRGPFGTSWPVGGARGGDIVVVAGGIGLAPLRPVVLAALAERDRYEQVHVLYGARAPSEVLYPGLLEKWRADADVEVTVDAAGPEWSGPVGFVAKVVSRAELRPEHATAFVCGPEIMMRTTIDALLAHGVPAGRIQVSLERHMDCGVGLCGHCQLGPTLICRDGPVYAYPDVARWLEVREL